MKSYTLPLTAIAIGLLLTGAPLRASMMDYRIESAAKKSYVFKTYLKADDIKVQSKDCVVTLTGTVASDSNKGLAQHTVEGLPGVKSVENRLEVKAPRPEEKSDAWLTTKVQMALLFHRNVSASKTEVSVKDGLVTLRGEAASQAQRELTTEYAKDVEGVKDVKNEMKVVNSAGKPERTIGTKIDDASITGQVKMALMSHRSTSALNTKVETKAGVVTLSGRAKNAAEKDLVTKLVTDVDGVKQVVNNMTIDAT